MASGWLRDDSKLHKLCHEGNLRKVKEFVSKVPDQRLRDDYLGSRKGVLGHTPFHEAAISGHHQVLEFLLTKAGDGHYVNCRSESGYTPLHLAAAGGNVDCLRILLQHKADVRLTDDYGKTPRQTAELSSKSSAVRILRSAGEVNHA